MDIISHMYENAEFGKLETLFKEDKPYFLQKG